MYRNRTPGAHWMLTPPPPHCCLAPSPRRFPYHPAQASTFLPSSLKVPLFRLPITLLPSLSSDSSHSDAMPPIGVESASIGTPPDSQSLTPSAAPIPITASSRSSSSRPFDPNTFGPRSARRPS